MSSTSIDLTFLERFCNGDRARMTRYVGMYLEGAPAMFDRLAGLQEAGDTDGLVVAAHSLRPQVHYMGAQALFDLLTVVETRARAEGAAACREAVPAAIALNATVMDELRSWAGTG